MTVDVVIEADGWDSLGLEALAARAEAALFAVLGLETGPYDAVLLAADDTRVAALNGTFRGKPKPTNVLSWPAEERAAEKPGLSPTKPEPGELGDMALAYGICQAEAQAAGKSLEDHVTHLIIHGLLHLLGYDHENEPDAALMEGLEIQALARLGIADPY